MIHQRVSHGLAEHLLQRVIHGETASIEAGRGGIGWWFLVISVDVHTVMCARPLWSG